MKEFRSFTKEIVSVFSTLTYFQNHSFPTLPEFASKFNPVKKGGKTGIEVQE